MKGDLPVFTRKCDDRIKELKANQASVKADAIREAVDNFQMVHEFTDGVSTDEYIIAWFKHFAQTIEDKET